MVYPKKTKTCIVCCFVAANRSNLLRHKKRRDHYTELEKPKIELIYLEYKHLMNDKYKCFWLVPMDLETYFGKFSEYVKSRPPVVRKNIFHRGCD